MIGLDDDGYPVAEDLERIKNFNPFEEDVFAFMDELRDLWAYADSGYWDDDPDPDGLMALLDQRKYQLSTAGWSGNEEIVAALQENMNFWMLFWHSTTRGGHYVFKVYQPKK